MKASILGLNLLQAFAMVSLSRNPTSTYIFWNRSSILLWGFALTYNSETPNTKLFKGLQSGELGGKTSFSHTSGRFSSWTCRGPWWWDPLGLRPGRSVCSLCVSCAPFSFQPILQKQKICLTSFKQCSFWCLHTHNLFHGKPGAKLGDYGSSRSFLLINIFQKVSVCFCFHF